MPSIPWEPGNNVSSLLEILEVEAAPSFAAGQLTIDGVSQAELEAAAAEYQANPETWYLAPMREKKSNHLQKQTNEFVSARYSPHVREMLHALLSEAALLNMPNRIAYLVTLLDWCKAVALENITADQRVELATTREEIEAVTLDLSALAALDPGITIKAAILIGD